MLMFLILFSLLTSSDTFFFNNRIRWEKFFIKSQELIQPITTRKINDIDKIKQFELETYFLKKEIKNLGNSNYDKIEYQVNNLDELMTKGVLSITSKSGSACGLILKFNIPKIDLILGFSLRNKYNDMLTFYQPLDSTRKILDTYCNNCTSVAAEYVVDNWLINKSFNYSYLKELFYNGEINEKQFFNDCNKILFCINSFYQELDES